MSNKYDKHQKSREPKFVATDVNGKRVYSGRNKEEFQRERKKYEAITKVGSSKSEKVKPQFDPNTGERIN